MRFDMRLAVVAACGLLAVSPGRAWGWGPEGHAVVGKVADQHLSKKAREAIKDLLTGHQFTSLADRRLTNFADSIKGSSLFNKKFPKMRQWHFIDLDVDKPEDGFKLSEITADQDNAIGAVKRFAAVLKDNNATLEDRRLALFFLAHFIGDIHQPLHCATRDDDHGGNLVHIAEDEHHTTNLHKVWDSELVHDAMGGLSEDDYATRLTNKLSAEKQKEFQQGKLEDWVLESHRLARKVVYTDGTTQLKKSDPPHRLSDKYTAAGAKTVEEQLTKGGVRLAQFLNDIFAE